MSIKKVLKPKVSFISLFLRRFSLALSIQTESYKPLMINSLFFVTANEVNLLER